MNRDIRDRWSAALQSGKYSQTTGRLTQGGGFCCLGVLCDLHSVETGTEWSVDGQSMESKISLPTEVVEWAGLRSGDPYVCLTLSGGTYNNEDTCLSILNDDFEFDFDQIAAIIEEEL